MEFLLRRSPFLTKKIAFAESLYAIFCYTWLLSLDSSRPEGRNPSSIVSWQQESGGWPCSPLCSGTEHQPPHCSDLLSLCVLPCLLSKAAATIKVRTSGYKTISENNLSALDRLIEDGSAHRIAPAALTSIQLIKSQKSHCCLNCV